MECSDCSVSAHSVGGLALDSALGDLLGDGGRARDVRGDFIRFMGVVWGACGGRGAGHGGGGGEGGGGAAVTFHRLVLGIFRIDVYRAGLVNLHKIPAESCEEDTTRSRTQQRRSTVNDSARHKSCDPGKFDLL